MARHDPAKSAEYWRNRAKAVNKQIFKEVDKYAENAQKIYEAARASIQKDLDAWLRKYAANEGPALSLADARKLLNKNELRDFKLSLEEFKRKALDPLSKKQLDAIYARQNISRLDALLKSIDFKINEVNELLLKECESSMATAYKMGYELNYEELQKVWGARMNNELAPLRDSAVNTLINKPWTTDKLTFRDRCWDNKEKLINELHTNFTKSIIRGDTPNEMIDKFNKVMKVSRYKAGRLIMTESAAILNKAQNDSFKELGVDEYQIVITQDGRACDYCTGLDGKVFKMNEFMVGITAPPFHPNCRCCTAPYIEGLT